MTANVFASPLPNARGTSHNAQMSSNIGSQLRRRGIPSRAVPFTAFSVIASRSQRMVPHWGASVTTKTESWLRFATILGDAWEWSDDRKYLEKWASLAYGSQ
jgi:hypothetical protein